MTDNIALEEAHDVAALRARPAIAAARTMCAASLNELPLVRASQDWLRLCNQLWPEAMILFASE